MREGTKLCSDALPYLSANCARNLENLDIGVANSDFPAFLRLLRTCPYLKKLSISNISKEQLSEVGHGSDQPWGWWDTSPQSAYRKGSLSAL